MPVNALTGSDTLTLNNRNIINFATDDVSTLDIPNNLVDMKTGKNGNTIFAENAMGFNGTLVIKLMRGSPDDQFVDGILNAMINSYATSVLIQGTFVKQIGDGLGNIINDSYTLSGGQIQKIPAAKSNVVGDTDQATTSYTIIFANVSRGIL